MAASVSPPISVMSFNLRYDNPKDLNNAWSAGRNALVATLIEKRRPTVIGAQEGLISQLKFLETRLKGVIAPHIGCGRLGSDKDEHCAIFYDPGIVEVEATGNFWLSEQPLKVGSSSWNSSLPRMCTWAAFHLKSNAEAKFSVWNTHLDHLSKLARENGIRVILEFQKTVCLYILHLLRI